MQALFVFAPHVQAWKAQGGCDHPSRDHEIHHSTTRQGAALQQRCCCGEPPFAGVRCEFFDTPRTIIPILLFALLHLSFVSPLSPPHRSKPCLSSLAWLLYILKQRPRKKNRGSYPTRGFTHFRATPAG
ncbi:unnamed protein product, partial [Ectocarpus sp. 12 AP-2014]